MRAYRRYYEDEEVRAKQEWKKHLEKMADEILKTDKTISAAVSEEPEVSLLPMPVLEAKGVKIITSPSINVDTEFELRCPGKLNNGRLCNKMFFVGKIDKIEIKCPRCKGTFKMAVEYF